jgi:hypothetical protein
MSSVTTRRWGDSQQILVSGIQEESANVYTKQLLSCHWRWPLTWCVQLIMWPHLPVTETRTFEVDWEFQIGCGQAVAYLPFTYLFVPGVGGVYAPVTDQKFIPAENLQAIASVGVDSPGTTGPNDYFTISAFAAPQTEPHAMTQLLEHVRGTGNEPDGTRWFRGSGSQGGFQEEPLRYR